MPPNLLKSATRAVRVPKDEGRELQRLAAERKSSVSAILLAQLGPLRKQLRQRINARLRSEGTV